MRVLKFGGKSLSSVEKTQKICKYVQKIYKKEKNIIIIVSARGKTTDELLTTASSYGDISRSPREVAKLLSTGEIESASLFAIMLSSMGIPSKSFSAYDLQIGTFGSFLNSKIAYINKKPIENCLKSQTVAIVAGFQGLNKNNEITTLGRGGSDTTAAAIGAIFDTSVEIYSDYNGIFAGDPKLLNFKKIKKANYDIMLKMAKTGAKVLDSRAVLIAKKFNTAIISKGSAEPEKKGSIVSNIESDITSISSISHLSKITINFSNELKLKFIIKNVLSCFNNIKFYNFDINPDKISFLIETTNESKIITQISKKLKLVKEKD